MATCEKCGVAAITQTRREHAAEVKRGVARDATQRAILAHGATLPDVEFAEDHDHPNMKTPSGAPIKVQGNGGDQREVCDSCGHASPWRPA